MHAVVLTYTQRTETSHTRWVPTSCTNITQLVSHTYETCFGKSHFSHGNNIIWFEARRVANINLRISLLSTTNDKLHQIDSFFGGAWHFLTTQIGTFFMIGILIPNSFFSHIHGLLYNSTWGVTVINGTASGIQQDSVLCWRGQPLIKHHTKIAFVWYIQ